MKPTLLTLSVLALSTTTLGVSFEDITLWIGSGSNRAAFVVDFNDGQTPTSYLWGYRWEGVATGEDMLRAIDVADSHLLLELDFFGSFGYSLNTARYIPTLGGYQHEQAFSETTEQYWSLWTTVNGSDDWNFAQSGMSQRTLTDGDVDGWAFSNPGYSAVAPTSPVAAVPEPMSLSTMTLGFSALVLRRRRKRSIE